MLIFLLVWIFNGYAPINCVSHKNLLQYTIRKFIRTHINTIYKKLKSICILVTRSKSKQNLQIHQNIVTYSELDSLIFFSVIVAYFLRNSIKIGEPGIVVQCNETLLNHKAKYHEGQEPKSQVWALFIVDISFNPARDG